MLNPFHDHPKNIPLSTWSIILGGDDRAATFVLGALQNFHFYLHDQTQRQQTGATTAPETEKSDEPT